MLHSRRWVVEVVAYWERLRHCHRAECHYLLLGCCLSPRRHLRWWMAAEVVRYRVVVRPNVDVVWMATQRPLAEDRFSPDPVAVAGAHWVPHLDYHPPICGRVVAEVVAEAGSCEACM